MTYRTASNDGEYLIILKFYLVVAFGGCLYQETHIKKKNNYNK